MGRSIFLLLLALSFTACSRAKPRGQVVRLEPDFTAKSDDKKAPEKASLSVQKSTSELPIPSEGEDAAVYHFTMGQAYALDNDPQRAIESYRATLVHDPKSALVRARLGAELVKIGAYSEAKTLCEEAIQLDPKYVDSYLLLAGIQVAAKEYEGAIDTYSKALKVDPKNRDALLYHGVTLAEVGRAKEGIAQLEKLVKLKDQAESSIDQGVAYYYLAKVYDQISQKENAITALKNSLKKRPGFAKAALALADLYIEKKDEKSAYGVMEETFRENPSSELAERLAEFYMERNNFAKAVVYLETLVEEDPANENMKLRLSLVYWQLKWYDKARLLLSGLLERYPASSEIAFYLGELELERKDFDGALLYYKKISPDYAKYDQMVNRVVFLYRQQKRYGEAESFLLEAMNKRADLVAFYPLLAALYEDQSKLPEARLALENGRKQFPADENILYYLGFLYDRLGQKEKGVATMEHLLSLNPHNANALNFVGYNLVEKGEGLTPAERREVLGKAQEYLERAMALKSNDAFVLDSYGWLLYRQGKGREAMKHLEKAAALKPEEGVISEHLADVYAALNMPQKAIVAYDKAIKAGGDKEFVARVESKRENVERALADGKPAKRVPAGSQGASATAGKRIPASR
jgi:tetratricopeptide (TPR) repeat protein